MLDLLGLPVPAAGRVFLGALAVHVLAGLSCVASGATAALSRKGGRVHVRSGQIYLAGLGGMLATVAVMVVVRWEHNARLLSIGLVAAAAGLMGYLNRRRGGHDRIHIAAMGLSYVALLTGFYVDNGPRLPGWSLLPDWSFWLLPSAVGAPVILAATRRHAAGAGRVSPPVASEHPGPGSGAS